MKKLLFVQPTEPDASSLWSGGLPKRLGVYRNNVHKNWTDTLDHDFPLTHKQFSQEEWDDLELRFFTKHPPEHWELNTSLTPFVKFLHGQKVKPFVKELADYEWNDLKIFIDRSSVRRGLGITNPTAVVRVYQHQIFNWVDAGAPSARPPQQKPEVLVFYRDSRNTCRIEEADPLMLLMIDQFRKPDARVEDLESVRKKLLPQNTVSLASVLETLKKSDLLLL